MLTLFTNGQAWLNRGYLLESLGPIADVDPTPLDLAVERIFPNAVPGERRYYVRIDDVAPEGAQAFGDWVEEWFATKSE